MLADMVHGDVASLQVLCRCYASAIFSDGIMHLTRGASPPVVLSCHPDTASGLQQRLLKGPPRNVCFSLSRFCSRS